MPFWGLVVTSLGFAIPTLIAFRKRRWVTTASCGALTLTSIAYHGTLHPLAHTIDMTLAHIMGMGWAGESVRRALVIGRPADGVICTMTIGSMLIYLMKSRNNFTPTSKMWHMAFHGLSQSAWCVYLLC